MLTHLKLSAMLQVRFCCLHRHVKHNTFHVIMLPYSLLVTGCMNACVRPYCVLCRIHTYTYDVIMYIITIYVFT